MFDGYDYTELFDAYGLELCPEEEIAKENPEDLTDYYAKAIQDYLEWVAMISMGGSRCAGPGPMRILSETAFELRCFLVALSEDGMSYHGPLWRGLSEVEDDWSLLQIAVILVPCMWD